MQLENLIQQLLRLGPKLEPDERKALMDRLAHRSSVLRAGQDFPYDPDDPESKRRTRRVLIAEVCEWLHRKCPPDEPLPLYRVLVEEYAQLASLEDATRGVQEIAGLSEELSTSGDARKEVGDTLLDRFFAWVLEQGDVEALAQVYRKICEKYSNPREEHAEDLGRRCEALRAAAQKPADLDRRRDQIAAARVVSSPGWQERGKTPVVPGRWLHQLLIETAEETFDHGKELTAEVKDQRRRLYDTLLLAEHYRHLHRSPHPRSALCLSGGGIRSATFNLGIVQGLARNGMLGEREPGDRPEAGFDYLSTVSGGGYLGSWLSAWIHREGRRKVIEDLARAPLWPEPDPPIPGSTSPLSPEPEPIQHLRAFSRFLAPRASQLSGDSMTLLAIYLRNLLVNWLILVPLSAALLLVPRLLQGWLTSGHARGSSLAVPSGPFSGPTMLPLATAWDYVPLAVILTGGISICYLLASRPSLTKSRFAGQKASQGGYVLFCLLPLGIAASLGTAWWARFGQDSAGETFLGTPLPHPWDVALLALASGLFGFVLSCFWRGWRSLWRRTVLFELVMLALASGLAGWLLGEVANRHTPAELQSYFRSWGEGIGPKLYTCLAVPTFLGVFLVCAVVWLGVASYFTNDADREWYARSGALTVLTMLLWSGLCAAVLFGPLALSAGALRWVLTPLGGLSGFISVLLGKSSKSVALPGAETGRSRGTEILLSIAAPVFLLFLIAALSLGTERLLDVLPGWMTGGLLFLTLLGIGLFASYLVNTNVFSLHAGYRDRLIRAYLGASRRRSERRPNPFSGFDERDNLKMKELRGCRPFHVVNAALNLVRGQELAWQDRKAETFTISSLHAGNLRLGFRDTAEYGGHQRPWWIFGGAHRGQGDESVRAISLGTAMAISGAAASPNMGYHSSPLITFLLTLFNVRLGWWLGNPGTAGKRTYYLSGPRLGPRPILDEAFGRTDDRNPYVYLSDGGHFENLGLYEMVVRRCRYILVSDASEDSGFSFDDLGNAVAKVRIDLGIPIDLQRVLMRRRDAQTPFYEQAHDAETKTVVPYMVAGRIRYSCVDPNCEDGYLIYVKSSLNGSEPVDVLSYARGSELFPHDSTLSVMFSESQFESYRALGSHIVSETVKAAGMPKVLPELFHRLCSEEQTKVAATGDRQRYFFVSWGSQWRKG